MVDDAPHQQRHGDRQRHVVHADGVEVAKREQPRADRTDDDRGLATELIRQVADEGDHEHRHDVAHDRDPQVDVFFETDPVARLDRVGRAEDRGDHGYDVHQGHADDPQHVLPAFPEGLGDRRPRDAAVLALLGERGRLLDLAADDVAGDDDDEAEQEWNAPAPGVERLRRHVMGQRQEHRRSQDLPRLHTLQGEAGVEAAPAEWRVLQNHRAGAGNLASHREALDQAQQHEQCRCEQADLVISGQQADRHGREPHQEHAYDQHHLAAVGVAPVPEEEGANGPRNVAHAVGCQ